jgi:hypothetical protein
MTERLTGGCLCGAIRYRYEGALGAAFNCHCSICRRSAGAPFVAWMTLNRASLSFDKGTPKYRASTKDGRRGFCPDCGTQLFFVFDSEPELIYSTVASHDRPNETPPRTDIYVQDRLDWVVRDEALDRFDEMPPEWPL